MGIEWVRGEWYIVPGNPYQPAVLAPQKHIQMHITDSVVPWMATWHHKGKLSVQNEHFNAMWYYKYKNRVKGVPLRRIQAFLVHHSTDIYCTPGERPNPYEPDVKLEGCWLALAPLDMLLAKFAVFAISNDPEDAAGCRSTCFPTSFIYTHTGDNCIVDSLKWEDDRCN